MKGSFILLVIAALLLIIIIPMTVGADTQAAVGASAEASANVSANVNVDARVAAGAAAGANQRVAAADSSQGTGIYVVRRGDTLFSIAARHCMTTTELFNLNSSILANPDHITVGMQLRVINRCGSGGSGGGGSGGNWGGGVCDRGPSQHAQGTVSGNRYFVARGDTSFSIATRFGIGVTTLCQANGIDPWRIFAGQTLIIPGLSGNCSSGCSGNWNCPPNNCWNCPPTAVPPNNCWNCPPNNCWNCPPTAVPPTATPPGNCWNCPPNNCWNCPPNNCAPGWNCPATPVSPRPTVVPITPEPTVITPFLQIDRPQPGETLLPTFIVSGRGGGLFEGNVLVQAQDTNGRVLAQQSVILQGSNVGAGGSGAFSTQLTVPSLTAMTPGWIVVSSPQSRVNAAFAQVFFSPGGGGGGTVTFPPNTCWVNVGAGRPFFSAVGGAQAGTFSGNGAFFARSGARGTDGQLWYEVGPVTGTSAYVWAPASSALATTGCVW